MHFARREGLEKRRAYSRSWSEEMASLGTGKLARQSRCFVQCKIKLYNTMICGLCEVALLDEAEELLLQMDKDGCPPNDLTFNVVVRAFLKRGDRHKVKIYL
ncbi:putative pentatricopeptide repeat-containing protein At1g12700, mitochondrial isoform X4 [Rhododendron vialii]|uniref:putative pentatricopeptide repeat-containing protein At1g12700, mitochondrial isoform X4 n=1 Tax=Rhododendron vialii TaxID=182163 RepID=UPI00265E0865|nr:putative pentatricopeptide repeat-containing protein At1g12700, mitochondrial isoform X4 [Rhododendron vialii]